MYNKQDVSYRILKKYGFLIEGPKEVLASLGPIPKIVEGETYKQWKERIFGDPSLNIYVYAPYEPSQNTKISTIQRESGGKYLKNVFSQYSTSKDEEKDEAIEETEQDIVRLLTTFPKDTLISLLDEIEYELQPSVKEFFSRYTTSTDDQVKTEHLLRDLIAKYNSAVKHYREKFQ